MGTTARPATARVRIPISTDPLESARMAGLRYVSDARPGIRRRQTGRGFTYTGVDGKPVRDPATLERIRKLAIPPAWTDVWICPFPAGHLQATGRDAKGRKQHRYHPLYRVVRDQVKYARLIAFAEALPLIRRRVREDVARPGMPRQKVLATIVRLLETTLIRVGNEEYAKDNDSYGLTTLRDEHVEVAGPRLRFRFRGKSGKEHEVEVSDPRVARIVKRCQELPGEELFQYVDEDGQVCDVTSEDVNSYMREAAEQDFTAKDFRTWNGTVLAAIALGGCEPDASEAQAKKNVVAVVKQVAERLGNRPAACRKYYLHPAVLESYTAGELIASLRPAQPPQPVEGLTPVETCVLNLLRKRLKQDLKELRPAV